jgi:putative DNA primase/helicase
MDAMFAPLTDAERKAAPKPANSAAKRPIVPVPADAPPFAFRHPRLGEPSKSWPYHDAEGRLVGYVCRWDFTDAEGAPSKEILPVTYCSLGNGRQGWRSKGMPAPRPLFGLPEILARPDATVLIAEGEKTRDAAAVLFPQMVATTPAHGAKSPHLTDFGPLAGRTVVIATDFDEAGQDFGDKACELVRAAGAGRVLHLHPDRLGAWRWQGGERVLRGEPLPDGWDLADALAEGWTAEAVADLQNDPAFLPPYLDAEERKAVRSMLGDDKAPEEEIKDDEPFRLKSGGVEKRVERVDKETGTVTVEWRWVFSWLEVEAETRSADGDDWGRLLVVLDRDGRRKRWAMPMAMLAGDGTEYRGRLLSLGLIIAPSKFARDALHEYISTARPATKARCVPRLGWQRGRYVLADRTVNPADHQNTAEQIILQTSGAVEIALRESGSLADWQASVAALAVGNSRLIFALSAAFAAPLIRPASAEGGIFHFRGASSTGKSTALIVAGSAWGGGGNGGWIRTWRATSNGLEGVATAHNDALLCLDELGQIDSREAGAAAYMLANGIGKSRAGRTGEARPPAEWTLLGLSTGEVGLGDKIGEDGRGRRAAAGQQVRIVDIPADAGRGLGIFETLHGFPSADAFARHLKRAAGEHYGHPTRSFLQSLVDDFDGIAPVVKEHVEEFVTENCPAGADGQVSRVCARFGLVAAGGEMATACGVLPWPKGEATKAAARCFADWLSVRGGIEPAEEGEAVSAVRRFVELHGSSRFEAMGDLAPRDGFNAIVEQRISNRVGFRRRAASGGIEYVVLPEAWKSEVCTGLDATAVAKALASRGLLIPGSGGKLQNFQRLPGFAGPVRCYVIASTILGDDEAADFADVD